MSEESPPPPPADAGENGARLWHEVLSEYELEQHEVALLHNAVRIIDRLDAMAAELKGAPLTVKNRHGDEVSHPLIVESRQQSLALSRIFASLRLPSGETGERPQHRGGARGAYGIRGLA